MSAEKIRKEQRVFDDMLIAAVELMSIKEIKGALENASYEAVCEAHDKATFDYCFNQALFEDTDEPSYLQTVEKAKEICDILWSKMNEFLE